MEVNSTPLIQILFGSIYSRKIWNVASLATLIASLATLTSLKFET